MGYFSVEITGSNPKTEAHLLMAARLSSLVRLYGEKIEKKIQVVTSWTYFWAAMMKRKQKMKFHR